MLTHINSLIPHLFMYSSLDSCTFTLTPTSSPAQLINCLTHCPTLLVYNIPRLIHWLRCTDPGTVAHLVYDIPWLIHWLRHTDPGTVIHLVYDIPWLIHWLRHTDPGTMAHIVYGIPRRIHWLRHPYPGTVIHLVYDIPWLIHWMRHTGSGTVTQRFTAILIDRLTHTWSLLIPLTTVHTLACSVHMGLGFKYQ